MRTSTTMQHDVSGILYPRKSAGDLRGIVFKPTDSKSSLSSVRTDPSSSMTKTTPLWASPSVMTSHNTATADFIELPRHFSIVLVRRRYEGSLYTAERLFFRQNNHSQLVRAAGCATCFLPTSGRG